MEYLTVKEASGKCGVGTRIIAVYCTESRIEGAVKKGNPWLIPKSAEKPADKRCRECKIIGSKSIGLKGQITAAVKMSDLILQ